MRKKVSQHLWGRFYPQHARTDSLCTLYSRGMPIHICTKHLYVSTRSFLACLYSCAASQTKPTRHKPFSHFAGAPILHKKKKSQTNREEQSRRTARKGPLKYSSSPAVPNVPPLHPLQRRQSARDGAVAQTVAARAAAGPSTRAARPADDGDAAVTRQ